MATSISAAPASAKVDRRLRLNGTSSVVGRSQPDTRPRTWAPFRSPLRIEYSSAALARTRLEDGDAETRGILLGVRSGNEVRICSASPIEHSVEAWPQGQMLVGIFVTRIRGEVFLTEEDLARFEQ